MGKRIQLLGRWLAIVCALVLCVSVARAQAPRSMDDVPPDVRAMTAAEASRRDTLMARTGELEDAGRPTEALPVYAQLIQLYSATYGPRHPLTGLMMTAYATAISDTNGDLAVAEDYARRALEIVDARMPSGYEMEDMFPVGLALIYERRGRLEDADQLFRRNLRRSVESEGPNSPAAEEQRERLIDFLMRQDMHAAARPVLIDQITAREQRPGGRLSEALADSLLSLAATDMTALDYAAVRRHAQRALTIYQMRADTPPELTLNVQLLVGQAAMLAGDAPGGAALLQHVIDQRQAQGVTGADPIVANAYYYLAVTKMAADDWAGAENALLRSRDMRRALGADAQSGVHNDPAILALTLQRNGRAAEAERILREDTAQLGCGPFETISPRQVLVELLVDAEKFDDAETVAREEVACLSTASPVARAKAMGALAGVLSLQRRAEAQGIYLEALHLLGAAREVVVNTAEERSHSLEISASLDGLTEESAPVVRDLLLSVAGEQLFAGDNGASRHIAQMALHIAERPGAPPGEAGSALMLVGLSHMFAGEAGEAEAILSRALALTAPTSSGRSTIEQLLALSMTQSGRTVEARPILLRLRAEAEGDAPLQVSALDEAIALNELLAARPVEAMAAARRASGAHAMLLYNRGSRRSLEQIAAGPSGMIAVRAAWMLAQQQPRQERTLFSEAFTAMQLAEPAMAADAIRRSNARFLAVRHNAEREWSAWTAAYDALEAADARVMGGSLLSLVSVPEELIGPVPNRQTLMQERVRATETLNAAQAALAARAPEVVDLMRPRPAELAATQQALGDDEALIQLTPGSDRIEALRGVVMVVTREGTAWAELGMSGPQLRTAITELRASIEGRPIETAGQPRMRALPGSPRTTSGARRYSLARAHNIYVALFGAPQVARLLQDKTTWLIAPQGDLVSLPFAALTTAAPAVAETNGPAALRAAPWLGLQRAIAIVPSIAAISARGAVTSGPGARDPLFFGVGAPQFNRIRAERATAPAASPRQLISRSYESGLATLAQLPNADHEIRELARLLRAPESSYLIGPAATERAVRDRSEALASADVVAFATHGLIAGAMEGAIPEPALALTPPLGETQSDDDDGLLLASEIAAMRLHARWVILSACDTAAGGRPNAPALTGLARAFFAAGARSLLVSHWPVEDDAAMQLTTRAVAIQQERGLTTARAMQESMIELVGRGDAYAHPSVWAPFALISVQ